jgi:hypothetical protein
MVGIGGPCVEVREEVVRIIKEQFSGKLSTALSTKLKDSLDEEAKFITALALFRYIKRNFDDVRKVNSDAVVILFVPSLKMLNDEEAIEVIKAYANATANNSRFGSYLKHSLRALEEKLKYKRELLLSEILNAAAKYDSKLREGEIEEFMTFVDMALEKGVEALKSEQSSRGMGITYK